MNFIDTSWLDDVGQGFFHLELIVSLSGKWEYNATFGGLVSLNEIHLSGVLAQCLAEIKHSIHVHFSSLRTPDPCPIHFYASIACIGDRL